MNLVHPDNLAAHWPEIRAGLCTIIRKTGERWLPEDVYHELKQGSALLFQRTGAFLVLKAHGRELEIWCAYNAVQGEFDSGLEWLKDHARANGFTRLTLTSPRKGWSRLFTPVSTNYEMEL